MIGTFFQGGASRRRGPAAAFGPPGLRTSSFGPAAAAWPPEGSGDDQEDVESTTTPSRGIAIGLARSGPPARARYVRRLKRT
jgi:hypothetical protein